MNRNTHPALVLARTQLLDNVQRLLETGKAKDREDAGKLLAKASAVSDQDLDLSSYDLIVVSSSAGKDSQAMLDHVVRLADAADFPRDRIVVAHADLGEMEWPGVRELAEEQAHHYGLRFEVVHKIDKQGNRVSLLDHIRRRGMFPGAGCQYCTAEHKRDPIDRLITQLCNEIRPTLDGRKGVRVLSCLGIRAEESKRRSKQAPITPAQVNGKWSSGCSARKVKTTWFPIYDWTTEQVWQTIRESGVRHHQAYDLGMPRLSCVFCVFAPEAALLVAGENNRPLLDRYVQVERETGHTFRHKFTIESVRDKLDAGERGDLSTVDDHWDM